MGEQPKLFFGKTIYTYSHDNSILAVSRTLVDAAAFGGLIWEYYHRKNPAFTASLVFIKKITWPLSDLKVPAAGEVSKPAQSFNRILAATNKNLLQEVKKGTFREVLFYRLNVIPIHLPSLRKRRNDIAAAFIP
jgi:hypothetical protein